MKDKKKIQLSKRLETVASFVEKEKINLYQVLCDYDLDGDGFITIAELLAAFKKIGIIRSSIL